MKKVYYTSIKPHAKSSRIPVLFIQTVNIQFTLIQESQHILKKIHSNLEEGSLLLILEICFCTQYFSTSSQITVWIDLIFSAYCGVHTFTQKIGVVSIVYLRTKAPNGDWRHTSEMSLYDHWMSLLKHLFSMETWFNICFSGYISSNRKKWGCNSYLTGRKINSLIFY